MRKRPLIALAAGVAAAGAATFAYSSLIERNLFTLRRFDVPVLEPDAEPLRILHISDLHMMPDQRRKQAWVAALAALLSRRSGWVASLCRCKVRVDMGMRSAISQGRD